MKRAFILLMSATMLLLVTGCDFIRTLAGRPTAARLEEIRLERMAREEARHQAVLDSLQRAEKQMADSLAALETYLLDSLAQTRGTILNPSKMGGLFTTKLESKYYIIVGAFRGRSYAERKLKACNGAGYTGTIISFRNGLLAVGVCPSNDLSASLKTLKEMRGKGICPQDAWILVNK